MSQDSTLKENFRKAFPVQAQLLELAKSQDEIDELCTRFVDEAQQKVIVSMKNSKLSDESQQKVIKFLSAAKKSTSDIEPIMLMNTRYKSLINARGNEIKNQIHEMINGLAVAKDSKDNNALFTALKAAGIVCAGLVAIGLVGSVVDLGAILILLAPCLAIVLAFIAVLAIILIPLFYFMEQPANCIITLVNELDKPLLFYENYFIHGELKAIVHDIPSASTQPDGALLPSMGFISAVKKGGAFYGTQYGFSMKYGDIPLSFGVENPLNGSNSCFCKIDSTAKHAAERTDHYNRQYFEYDKDGISVSIRCNSKKGSTAYYVARAFKTNINNN